MPNNTVEKFAELVLEQLVSQYKETIQFRVEKKQKNNGGEQTGIAIRNTDTNVGVVVYLDDLFQNYAKESLDTVCEKVMEVYEKNKPASSYNCDAITDFSIIKNRLYCKLINAEMNAERLKTIPHIRYLDLAIIFYIQMAKTAKDIETLIVQKKLQDIWKVTTSEICEIALRNTQKDFHGEIFSMDSYMIGETPKMDASEYYEIQADLNSSVPMYIATNEQKTNGACVILYPNLLDDFAAKLESNFYILPSSIHEVIFVPADDRVDIETAKSLVMEVNSTDVVAEEEILSNHIYLYDRISKNVYQY